MSDEMSKSGTSPASRQAEQVAAGHIIDAKHEPFRVYKIVDKDDTLIETTARQVSEGSKLIHNFALWHANFQATILRVRQWCAERSDRIRLALVDIRSNKVLFYFVPQSGRYHLPLGSEMTDLEIELGGSAGIGYVESLQVPYRSLTRFAGPKSLIIWYRSEDDLPSINDAMPDDSHEPISQ